MPCSVVDPRNPRKFETKTLPKWQRKILAQNPSFDYTHHETMFDEDFCSKLLKEEEGLETSGVLVTGMHPDEATEPIVDLCLQYNWPFAVIPCCVFAHKFPSRVLKSGGEPKTYEQFCDYLAEKDPRIQRQQLDFQGRNVVLFKK